MSQSLKQRLQDAVKDAMKSKAKERLAVLRLVTAAIKQKEVDDRVELDDEAVLTVLDKMVKQRRESISQFQAANRNDLADKESQEIEVIQEFMPEPLSDSDIEQMIKDAITQTGASSMKDMGKVMGGLQAKMKGRADMGAVSAKIKAILSA